MVFMKIRLIWGALVRNRRKSSEYYYSTINSTYNGFNEVFQKKRLKEKYPSSRWAFFGKNLQMG